MVPMRRSREGRVLLPAPAHHSQLSLGRVSWDRAADCNPAVSGCTLQPCAGILEGLWPTRALLRQCKQCHFKIVISCEETQPQPIEEGRFQGN